MAHDLSFQTQVSGRTPKGLELRGIPLEKLIAEADFVSTLFLSITGTKPTPGQAKMLNALLVAAIDHGIEPASGFIPRVVASSGNSILTAMATSILALGPYHGGAITDAMRVFETFKHDSSDIELACAHLIGEYKKNHKRIPGYGHAVYKDEDPRAQQLLKIAQASQLDPFYSNVAQILEQVLENTLKKKLVLNVDGAMAALLVTLGFPAESGNAIFAVARVAGSIAHIVEEQQAEHWVRRLDPSNIEYSSKTQTKSEDNN